jgi:Tfp pilus assembly protein PilF
MIKMVALGLVGALAAGGAVAQDRTVYRAINAGDLAGAETRLAKELRTYPGSPEVMLNLAAIYSRTGRAEQARALYADVLDRRAVMLDLPSGAVRSSHDVANAGLNRLSPLASAN